MQGSPFQLDRFRVRAPAMCVVAAALVCGCSMDRERETLRHMHEAGRYDLAAKALDSHEADHRERNRVLWLLDRGAVALALGDSAGAVARLEEAERLIEARPDLSAAEDAARWVANDNLAPYRAEPYEDMYVNVLKLLAQLERGAVAGGATVEVRRMASKANRLRDRYLKDRESINRRGGSGFESAARSGVQGRADLMRVNEDGRFVESPLGDYLTAVTYMEAGDPSNQAVAARRLLDAIRQQAGLIGPVREDDFTSLGELSPSRANVLIVALSGRGPWKRSERIGPIPVFDWPVYFELPVLERTPSEASAARVVVAREGTDSAAWPGGAAESQVIGLSLIEDIGLVAEENHKRQLPLTYARALLRASLKSGASFAATQAVRNSTDDDLAHLAAVLAGLAFVALTEKADLRCWVFLPGQAHVGLLDLPPGRYRARVEYLSAEGGLLYAGPETPIIVDERGDALRGDLAGAGSLSTPGGPGGQPGLATVVDHFWR